MNILAHPPAIHPIKSVIFPEVIISKTPNAIPVYEIRKADCGLIMAELVFIAGRPFETKKLVSSCVAPMMREGAGPFSSEDFSEKVDFFGATVSINAGLDSISIKIICLKKHFAPLIDLVGYCLSDPWFSQEELESFIARRNDKLGIELVKNEVISYRELTEAIFGKDHSYGYNSTAALYKLLSSEDLKAFHSTHITTGNCTLFLSGEIRDEDYKLIYALTDHIQSGSRSKVIPENLIVKSSDQRIMRIAGAKNQCSIKLGRFACKRSDSEYLGLLYLSTVLGGYFGSRLVTNLREEKGITYGIYSTIDALLYDGLLLISTEVANDQVELCLREIYQEMDRLKNDKISAEELQTVNNYLMGHFINLFDGPFNSIRAIKSLVLNSISLDTLSSLFEESISFDENSIQALAQKYLNREEFWEITVGMVE